MKIYKFLIIIAFITVFSLLYVYQQTEVFRLAYLAQKRQAFFQDLLDKNSILRYNIEKSASLIYIGDKISGSADFQMPDSYRLVRLTNTEEGLRFKSRLNSPKETILSRLFGIKTQAEAKSINP